MASLLKQANQVLNLIAQREPGLLEWDLQALIESGFISDLLLLDKKQIERIDRTEFRKFIGLQPRYEVQIQGGVNISMLIEHLGLDRNAIDPEVKGAVFGVPIGFQGSFDAHIFLLSKRSATEEVKIQMYKQGLRPGIAAELLTFVNQDHVVRIKGNTLIALGEKNMGRLNGFLAYDFGPEPYLHIVHPHCIPQQSMPVWSAGTSFLAVPLPERGGPRYFTGF